jgi:hypothetical protein
MPCYGYPSLGAYITLSSVEHVFEKTDAKVQGKREIPTTLIHLFPKTAGGFH